MPATAASRYCSGLSESSFSVVSVPSGRLPTMSVKVPPRSIQNCQRRGVASSVRSIGPAPVKREADQGGDVVHRQSGRARARRRRRAACWCTRGRSRATLGMARDQAQRRGDGRRARPAPRRARRDRRARARETREPGARPSIGVSSRAPTACRCAGVSDAASAVTTPTRRPPAVAASSSATSSRLDVHTGTGSAACISRWNSARKPQLVVIAAHALAHERTAPRR